MRQPVSVRAEDHRADVERDVIVGIDVGGTFTDVIAITPARTAVRKTPSRPDEPGTDVVEGMRLVATDLGFPRIEAMLATTRAIFHGSTIATNVLLTRSADPVGLITTAGFADVIEMRGGIREATFDSHLENAVPLAPRHLRLEASEEVDREGRVLRKVRPDEIRALVRQLKRGRAGSVAIAFKHSHANPENEEAALTAAQEAWPDAYITLSSRLVRRARLYDRVSTAVVNSYVGPHTSRYLGNLADRLATLGFAGQLLIMSGNGGVTTAEEAARRPSALILSGPAGGPTAGRRLLRGDGHDDGVIVDMGGTSFDVSLLRAGHIHTTSRSDVNRYRLGLPMLEIHTIGAGGGSIASVDEVGLLRVGPESAGAVPGPASYDMGGAVPTVTDASVVLGLLPGGTLLGGARRLNVASAATAIRERIARPLGLSLEMAALGIHAVANANMAAAVREMTMGKGVDPSGLPLVVGGGAGPLHGAKIAEALGFTDVLVPWDAGVLCALGLAHSDVRYDQTTSLVKLVDRELMTAFPGLLDRVGTDLTRRLEPLRAGIESCEFVFDCELRYQGQFHELSVPTPEPELRTADPTALLERFSVAHQGAYGFAPEGTAVELVNLRTTLVARLRRPAAGAKAEPRRILQQTGTRAVFVEGDGWIDARVLAESSGPGEDGIDGPAVIELQTTTIFVPPHWHARARATGIQLARGGR